MAAVPDAADKANAGARLGEDLRAAVLVVPGVELSGEDEPEAGAKMDLQSLQLPLGALM
jgi:hypothetical protein